MTQRLTIDQVAAIRARYAAGGATLKAIAANYGVGYTAIQKIVRGARWAERTPVMELMPAPERRWSDAEIEYLSNHRDDAIADQATALNRSTSAVMVQRSRLELTRETDDLTEHLRDTRQASYRRRTGRAATN